MRGTQKLSHQCMVRQCQFSFRRSHTPLSRLSLKFYQSIKLYDLTTRICISLCLWSFLQIRLSTATSLSPADVLFISYNNITTVMIKISLKSFKNEYSKQILTSFSKECQLFDLLQLLWYMLYKYLHSYEN